MERTEKDKWGGGTNCIIWPGGGDCTHFGNCSIDVGESSSALQPLKTQQFKLTRNSTLEDSTESQRHLFTANVKYFFLGGGGGSQVAAGCWKSRATPALLLPFNILQIMCLFFQLWHLKTKNKNHEPHSDITFNVVKKKKVIWKSGSAAGLHQQMMRLAS